MNKYDKRHMSNLSRYGAKVDAIYKEAIKRAARLGIDLHGFDMSRPFAFDDYPILRKKADKLIAWLNRGLAATISDGVADEWALSNAKNDALVETWLGVPRGAKGAERYFNANEKALGSFLKRKAGGMNLSDRVWQYSERFKDEIELGLDLGIRTGRSADEISRDLRLFLNRPAELYRRVRTQMVDKDGNPIWRNSKAAEMFTPGRGVYRSSYKNARRLAATETNMAYRKADNERWAQLDFVIGQHVLLSNNHPDPDICNDLSGRDEKDAKGRYPKDFVFTGWHPLCRCYCVPIMSDLEEMEKQRDALLNGDEYTPHHEQITEMPDEFNDWVSDNAARIGQAAEKGTLPYFIKDNVKYFGDIIG